VRAASGFEIKLEPEGKELIFHAKIGEDTDWTPYPLLSTGEENLIAFYVAEELAGNELVIMLDDANHLDLERRNKMIAGLYSSMHSKDLESSVILAWASQGGIRVDAETDGLYWHLRR